MSLRTYTILWLILSSVLGYEYWNLNFHPELSYLLKLQASGKISKDLTINPLPGRPLSLWLGWIGLGLMVIMNVYSIRKRAGFMRSWGKLTDWLNFHVFCGLLGPTLILAHCNLKVRGLVAISFWSMVISFSSGVVGRYFYMQMLRHKKDFESLAEAWERKLTKYFTKKNIQITDAEKAKYLKLAFIHSGGVVGEVSLNPFSALFRSFSGDIRLMFSAPPSGANWPPMTQTLLKNYGVNQRRAQFLSSFQRLMGYWHAFHFPFAVFMYVAAVIHVCAALIFGV